jgi:acyl-CoA synthetase (NDP forming)
VNQEVSAAVADDARRRAVATMLGARSVAVVGASAKAGSLGEQMMIELARGGFDGSVYPVNPGDYDEIGGYRCFKSIREVPEPVDLAILGVANHRVEQALGDAAEAGAKSATTFSSLYEDDPEPGTPPLTERLAAIAERHGMAFCGGNGMGFLNLEAKLRATGFPTPDVMRLGPVAFVSHSGSAFAAVAFNDRGIGFNLLVSSGQEIVTRVEDYVDYALDLESTRDRVVPRDDPAPRSFPRRAGARGRTRDPGRRTEGRARSGLGGDGRGALRRTRR